MLQGEGGKGQEMNVGYVCSVEYLAEQLYPPNDK